MAVMGLADPITVNRAVEHKKVNMEGNLIYIEKIRHSIVSILFLVRLA